MIILDVDLKTFKSFGYGYHRVFFINREAYIEMYSITGEGILYRYVYFKSFDEDDLVFEQTNLQNATEVMEITSVNDDSKMKMLEALYQKLDEIERAVKRNGK